MVVSGKSKAKIMAEWLNSKVISPQLPASILLIHPNFTLILDEDAASEINM